MDAIGSPATSNIRSSSVSEVQSYRNTVLDKQAGVALKFHGLCWRRRTCTGEVLSRAKSKIVLVGSLQALCSSIVEKCGDKQKVNCGVTKL